MGRFPLGKRFLPYRKFMPPGNNPAGVTDPDEIERRIVKSIVAEKETVPGAWHPGSCRDRLSS